MPRPYIGAMVATLEGEQDHALKSTMRGPLTIDKYRQIIKPFIKTKTSPDNLANEIQSKANTEAVIMILDKSGVIKHITNKFFLSNMQMTMREKFQLMETFGAANISFFGEAARIYIFTASTIDASSQDSGISQGKYYYQSSILKMYNEVLRGSQLIKEKRVAVMKVSNHLIYGYPLNLQVQYDAASSPVTQFVLQFLVADHSLELPGVLTESYLSSMYSISAHINNDAIRKFINKIEKIEDKINAIFKTVVYGKDYNSVGTIELVSQGVSNSNWSLLSSGFGMYKYQPDSMKSAFTALLAANVSTLKTTIGSDLDGEISPLVESKVPKEIFEKLLAIIPTMFKNESNYDMVTTHLGSLIELKRELEIFKVYRINSDSGN